MKIRKYLFVSMGVLAAFAVDAQTRSPLRAGKPVSADLRDLPQLQDLRGLRSVLKEDLGREVPPRRLSEDEQRQLREQLTRLRRESRGH